jgi:hypothetical protein
LQAVVATVLEHYHCPQNSLLSHLYLRSIMIYSLPVCFCFHNYMVSL